MNPEKYSNHIHFLPPEQWKIDGQSLRSEELTPLYVDRYDGLRTNPFMSSHNYWEITFVFNGKGILKTDREFSLEPNTICIIPPNTKHTEISKDKMDTLWVGVHGTKLTFLNDNQIYIIKTMELNNLFERLWIKAESPYGSTGPELDGLVQTIFGSFIRLIAQVKRNNTDYIDDAIQYIQKNFSENFPISFLANKFGYSEGYFFRAFKKRTGQTPISFIMRLRIQQANRMLNHTSLSVKKISKMVGFNDPLYFSRVFTKIAGVNPTTSRQQKTHQVCIP